MRMPPGRATFTLEEGRARVLVASSHSTLVAWCLDVIVIEFNIVDLG